MTHHEGDRPVPEASSRFIRLVALVALVVAIAVVLLRRRAADDGSDHGTRDVESARASGARSAGATPRASTAPGPVSTPAPAVTTRPEPVVDPVEGGCPPSHPVKAKASSRIFHVPGGANYDRTRPDRCYLDAAAAEADGFRRSKR